jgi:hypothetical protein
MPAPRYLTKSRFKLALECPTKLYYTGKPELYPDQKRDDEFLQALAEGGFQVGELAKLMFPGGIEVTALTHDEQVTETRRLLEREDVTIFEAAIRHGNLFARIDVLLKRGRHLELIEVKAKSFDSASFIGFRGARGGIQSAMTPYLRDVSFQRHLLDLAYPGHQVSAHLMLADKAKTCSVDRLNQRFKIRRVNDRSAVTVMPGTDASSLGTPVLTQVNVDDLVDEILRRPIEVPGACATLAKLAADWGERYRTDSRIAPTIGAHCARCEFRMDAPAPGQRNGLHDCWRDAAGFTAADFAAGSVLDLANFRGKQALIDQKILRLSEVPLERLRSRGCAQGLSLGQRQAMQVTGHWAGRPDFFLDAPLMRRAMSTWRFPLHFIDFETARVAIPFFAGQRPYANIAFQFSHHVIEADGRLEHRAQFLSTTPGRSPNVEFARALRASLGSVGTVFMWTPHERTTLNAILEELEHATDAPPDASQLKAFIRSLTQQGGGARQADACSRSLVDLCDLARRAFFHPATKGSSSIKKVLPAVMRSSEYLRQRYAQPNYGSPGGIPSLNFVGQAWWREEDGKAIDPYRLLPPVFSDFPPDAFDSLDFGALGFDEDLEIAQGGAATTAFSRLQFEDIDPRQRRSIEAALLRYCELDTLAMAMVYEAWRDWAA